MEVAANQVKPGIKDLMPHKGYMLSLTAGVISRLGDSLDSVAYAWMVYLLTGSKLLLGSIFAVSAIPNIVFSPFVGPLVDRIPKKALVVMTNIGRGVLVSITAALFFLNLLRPWHLFIVIFINSTLETVNMPAAASFFPMLIPKELFLTANSFSSSLYKVSELAGLTLAPVVIALVGISGAIFIDGATFFAAAVLIMLIKRREETKSISELTLKVYFSDLKEGFLFIKNNAIIFISIILFSIVNFCISPISVLEPAFVKDILKSGPEFQSVLGISITVGMILGGILVAQYGSKFKISTLIITGLFIFGISYSALIVPVNLSSSLIVSRILAALSYGIIGLMIPIMSSPLSTYIISNTPREMTGRVFSVLQMLTLCAMPLGSFLSGVISQYLSIQTLFFVMGIFISLLSLLLLTNKPFRKA